MKSSLAFGLILFWAGAAAAHKPSDSFLTLHPADMLIEAQWDIALRDLDHAIGLDSDGDAAITWGELRRRHAAIAAYALPRLQLHSEAGPCMLDVREHLIDRHSDGAYAVLRFVADCGPHPAHLTVRYRLFFDLDPQHRGILRVGDTEEVLLFSVDTPEQRVVFNQTTPRTAPDFWRNGIRRMGDLHQLLFLTALLVPSFVRSRESSRVDCFKLVAALTVAHSLTFTLATQHAFSLAAVVFDVGIALSVIMATASHVVPTLATHRWMIAFAFGLLHGFDLAAAFTDGPLPLTATVPDLLSFNLGVASGQCLVVGALLFPLTWRVWRDMSPRIA